MAALGNIMPTGDSITRGFSSFPSGTQGTYRRYLTEALDLAGHTYDMVGPFNSHPSGDYLDQGQWDHDCFAVSGWEWADILDGAIAGREIEERVTEYNVDLILFYMGVNDIRNLNTVASAIAGATEAVERARGANPDIDFIFAELAPVHSENHADPETINANIDQYNAELRDLVLLLDTPQSRTLIVDCNTGFTDAMLFDTVHPNDDGDQFIAPKFEAGIETLLTTDAPYDFIDPDPTPDTTHAYRVRALDENDVEGDWSDPVNVEIPGDGPTPPFLRTASGGFLRTANGILRPA